MARVKTPALVFLAFLGSLSCLALTGCATVNLATKTGQLTTGNAQNETILAADSPQLAGKEILFLPQPRHLKAFDFNTAIMAQGTADRSQPMTRTRVARTKSNLYDVVSVYWGTDRKLEITPLADARTGRITTGSISAISPPGPGRGDNLILGRARITIPKVAREKGEIKRPWQITFLHYTLYRQSEDPRKHFTLGKLERMDEADFISSANRHLSRAQRFKDEAFVFVHGFNISFEDALYRTAQLAYDLEFDGVPYLYSWPSKAEKSGYLYDRDSADRARHYFLKFLELVATKTKAKRIHIIAHSLGARLMIEALDQESQVPGRIKKLKLGEIILAAPDIDRDVFKDIASVITHSGTGTTLYAADNDRPLQISRLLARGKPRAGEVTKKGPMIIKNLDTIDVSDAGTSSLLSLHHNTYADNARLLSDIRLLLQKGLHPPSKRSKQFKTKKLPSGGVYWKFAAN